LSLNASKEKKLRNKLKGFEHEKKLQQNSLLFSYLSIQNTEDIILGFNRFPFFEKKNLKICMVDLHHNVSNEWVCFLEKKTFLRKKKKRSWWSLGHVPTLILDPFRLFLRWRHAHFSQFFVAINLRTTEVYCFKCVSKKKGCVLKNCNQNAKGRVQILIYSANKLSRMESLLVANLIPG